MYTYIYIYIHKVILHTMAFNSMSDALVELSTVARRLFRDLTGDNSSVFSRHGRRSKGENAVHLCAHRLLAGLSAGGAPSSPFSKRREDKMPC